MIFEMQRFIFGFLFICSLALFVTGCTNRPAGERWKFGSNNAELMVKPVDYIYAPSTQPDGSLSDTEARKLSLFLKKSGLRSSDQLIVQSSNSYRGENAAQWVSYWLKNQELTVTMQSGTLGLSDEMNDDLGKEQVVNPVQVVVRRYQLSVPNCERNMSAHITTVTSTTRATLGCSNVANLAHMVADPSHVANGSDPGYMDGEQAASGVYEYWAGETEPLIVEQFDVLDNSSGDE
ncbi:CpaD family pilus assembly lipoprotein [Curvivirga sp.]|uniref:CpaD family pilus assembly lipoprotein n=1 Tax=Curvivirga sp. TaxID=2856848 RepID=UPI003B5C9AE3